MSEQTYNPGDVVEVTELLADDEEEGLCVGDVGVVQGSDPDMYNYPWHVYFWRIRKQRPMAAGQMRLHEKDEADDSVERSA